MSGLTNDLQETLDKVRDLYQVDKLLQCARLLEPLQAHLKSDSPEADSSLDASVREALRAALSTEELTRIQSECAEVHDFQKALNEKEGWTISYDGDETKVWYRREPNTSTHSILIEGTIRAPLLNIAALLYESDLYHNLFWYVLGSSILQTPPHATLLRRATHINAYAPWPLHNRDVALYAFAVDALDQDDNAVYVVSRSIREGDGIVDSPQPGPRVVRATFHNSGIEMRPESPNKTRARFLYNVDPELGFLPMPLVNWGARFMCRWSLRILESRARDLDAVSPLYTERMTKGEVYVRVKSRLAEYWSEKGEQWDEKLKPEAIERPSGEFDADDKPAGPPRGLMKNFIFGQATNSTSADGEPSGSNNEEDLARPKKRLSSLLFR